MAYQFKLDSAISSSILTFSAVSVNFDHASGMGGACVRSKANSGRDIGVRLKQLNTRAKYFFNVLLQLLWSLCMPYPTA